MALLQSVYFVNANTGYAVGDGGTILKTNDGGTSWVSKFSEPYTMLWSVYFTDVNTSKKLRLSFLSSLAIAARLVNRDSYGP
jgi:hypothetical protein